MMTTPQTDAFSQPGAAARLFAGAERHATMIPSPDEIDAAFQASGDRVSAFAIRMGLDPAQAGRSLVAAGSLSKDDPRAIATQDAPSADLVARMKTPAGLIAEAEEAARSLAARNLGREGAAAINGLRRMLKSSPSRVSPETVAGVFEAATVHAATHGDSGGMALAGRSFVAATQVGLEQSRLRQKSRSRDGDAR